MKSKIHTLITAVAFSFTISSCVQSNRHPYPTQPPTKKEGVLLENDQRLKIDLKYISKGKQQISSYEYARLPENLRAEFVRNPKLERPHKVEQVLSGNCRNTLIYRDKHSGKIIHRCGGHHDEHH